MANIIVDDSFVVESAYDMQKLVKQSKAFHNYLKSAVAKIVGSKKAYNRTLVKPIAVADDAMFMIRFVAEKKTTTNLKITYTLTAPDDTVAIKMEDAEYTVYADLESDFNTIDGHITAFANKN